MNKREIALLQVNLDYARITLEETKKKLEIAKEVSLISINKNKALQEENRYLKRQLEKHKEEKETEIEALKEEVLKERTKKENMTKRWNWLYEKIDEVSYDDSFFDEPNEDDFYERILYKDGRVIEKRYIRKEEE